MIKRLSPFLLIMGLCGCSEQNKEGFFSKASTNFGLICQNTDVSVSSRGRDLDFTASAIYGEDNRLDWYESPGQTKDYWARATLALMSAGNLYSQGDGYRISASTYKETAGLCDGQPFADQPAAAFCSGFLVASDLVVTAGHCIQNLSDCRSTRFVFDYAKTTSQQEDFYVPAESVYSCDQVVAQSTGASDFAVVRLDRSVQDRTPLNVRRQGSLAVADQVMLIGHPMGLPSKIADGGFVQSIGDKIEASVDAFAANSGSVILNSATGLVEGILVAGEPDFRYENGCRVEAVCGSQCDGEVITPIAKVLAYLPETYYENPICPGE